MISELVKILEKIAKGINDNYSFEQVENSVNLENRSDKTVIAAAYSWIYEKFKMNYFQKIEMKEDLSKGLRVLSGEEIGQIGLQNYNYLLHFYNIGLLNNSELEMIIDQIKLFPETAINKDSINMLILSVFLDLDKVSLPGSRYLLYSYDTIN